MFYNKVIVTDICGLFISLHETHHNTIIAKLHITADSKLAGVLIHIKEFYFLSWQAIK